MKPIKKLLRKKQRKNLARKNKTHRDMTKEEKSLHKIEMHERECAIRYEYIEKRLNEGSEKFKRIEIMLWGLYGVLAASLGVDKFF